MIRCVLHLAAEFLSFCILAGSVLGQLPPQPLPELNYNVITNFFQLPPGEHLVEPAGVAVNSKGHIYVFHRGKHPLMEFDPSGKFLRSIADDLFVTAHMVRVDIEDNIWTADIGSHVVLKLTPEGKVLLALGRMRIPGDDVLHFNQPTDIAWDRDGNVYVTDGYGNSRVLKFDKYGNPLLGWGMKGTGPGQFDTPHTIVIDGDLVYVGDRENTRIQIFDRDGRFFAAMETWESIWPGARPRPLLLYGRRYRRPHSKDRSRGQSRGQFHRTPTGPGAALRPSRNRARAGWFDLHG
jgi:DNA-binding beta-propeller fold protein YncE